MSERIIKASDCKCCKCGAQAVAFWPCIDPDIPQHPYCRECLDSEKYKAILAILADGDDGIKDGSLVGRQPAPLPEQKKTRKKKEI